MSYDVAIDKAWTELEKMHPPAQFTVRFLDDEYSVDVPAKKILSLSCNVPAKDFTVIIILHYLAKSFKGLPVPAGEWLTFREFSGIEGYYDAFKRRCIDPIIRRGVSAKSDDASRVLYAFDGVPVLIKFWKADAEFGPDANIFFDKSITQIFCTEDIVVLAGLAASKL
jgi:hypothetical protein